MGRSTGENDKDRMALVAMFVSHGRLPHWVVMGLFSCNNNINNDDKHNNNKDNNNSFTNIVIIFEMKIIAIITIIIK